MDPWDIFTSIMDAPVKLTAEAVGSVTGSGDVNAFADRLKNKENNNSWGDALNSMVDPTQTTNAFAYGTGKVMPDWMKEGQFPALVDTIAAILYGYAGVAATSGLVSQFKDENPNDAWTKAGTKAAVTYVGTAIGGGAQGGVIPNASANAVNATAIGANAAGDAAYKDAIAQGLTEAEATTAREVAVSAAPQVAEKTGTVIAEDTAKKVATNYVKKYAIDTAAGAMAGGPSAQSQGFNVADTPLAAAMVENNKNLDLIIKKAGETGDYQTAADAAKKYEDTTTQYTRLESEIFKYSGDPQYQAIEPELRVFADEALKKGMDPKEAAKYAFEKAKKAKALKTFLADFTRNAKSKLASWGDQTITSTNQGYTGKEKLYPNQMEGVNSPIRSFTPQSGNNPNDPMLYDPAEIDKYRNEFTKYGVSL